MVGRGGDPVGTVQVQAAIHGRASDLRAPGMVSQTTGTLPWGPHPLSAPSVPGLL